MKWIVAGGAALKKEVMLSLKDIFKGCDVIQSYGQTETGGPMFRWDVTRQDDVALLLEKLESTGKPYGGNWYKVGEKVCGKVT